MVSVNMAYEHGVHLTSGYRVPILSTVVTGKEYSGFAGRWSSVLGTATREQGLEVLERRAKMIELSLAAAGRTKEDS